MTPRMAVCTSRPLCRPDGTTDLSDPEVEELHRAVIHAHDVAGLQVAMEDACLVHGRERVRDLLSDLQALLVPEELV